MADAPDPNTAPSHPDVREQFSALQIAIVTVAGVTAAILGIVLGVTLVNN